jgi:hypothetical protein
MTDTAALLDAVDALTQPIRRLVMQDILEGEHLTGQKAVHVELPPLLDQLDEAIRGTVGIGSSGSLANERSALNADAFHKAVMITTLIRDWATVAKIEYRRDTPPADLLRTWYTRYTQQEHEQDVIGWHIRTMMSWVGQIETMFDPPRTQDLPNACPVCGAKTWWQDGQEYPRPLIITYRDDVDMIGNAKGMCRSCETVWNARELAYTLEHTEGHAANDPA